MVGRDREGVKKDERGGKIGSGRERGRGREREGERRGEGNSLTTSNELVKDFAPA